MSAPDVEVTAVLPFVGRNTFPEEALRGVMAAMVGL